jgi:hypothetical protein
MPGEWSFLWRFGMQDIEGVTPAGSGHDEGYSAGLQKAAQILRDGALSYRTHARDTKKVLDEQAGELAAVLLESWANGLEIEANK